MAEQNDGMGRTTISVDDETADELHELKQRGESYDDVVNRLLEAYDDG
jgi:predicted CopG family antitoxin